MADRPLNVRDSDVLGQIIGRRVVDVTQHDEDEFQETKRAFVAIHFDNGMTVEIPIGDEGFDVEAIGPEFDGS